MSNCCALCQDFAHPVFCLDPMCVCHSTLPKSFVGYSHRVDPNKKPDLEFTAPSTVDPKGFMKADENLKYGEVGDYTAPTGDGWDKTNFTAFMAWISPALEQYGFIWRHNADETYTVEKDGVVKTFDLGSLLSRTRQETLKSLGEWVEAGKYEEDHEDLGAEAIANHAYETKFEAFMYGYNEALKEVSSELKHRAGEMK